RACPISHPPSLCYRRSPESGPTQSHTTPSAAELILQHLHEHGGRRPLLALAAEPRFGRRLREDLFPVTYEGFSLLTRCPILAFSPGGRRNRKKRFKSKIGVFVYSSKPSPPYSRRRVEVVGDSSPPDSGKSASAVSPKLCRSPDTCARHTAGTDRNFAPCA